MDGAAPARDFAAAALRSAPSALFHAKFAGVLALCCPPARALAASASAFAAAASAASAFVISAIALSIFFSADSAPSLIGMIEVDTAPWDESASSKS